MIKRSWTQLQTRRVEQRTYDLKLLTSQSTTELKDLLTKFTLLQTSYDDLLVSHSQLRAELVETRRHMLSTPSTPTSPSMLTDKVIALEQKNQDLEAIVSGLRTKVSKLKMESAARIYDLEEQLKRTCLHPRFKFLVHTRSRRTPGPIPDLLMPRIQLEPQGATRLVELEAQLESKNQLIMDLSMRLAESQGRDRQVIVVEGIAKAAD